MAACAQVIPIGESGQLAEAFNIRLEELNVIDLKFLHGCAKPTLALLHQDPKNARHLRTYVVDLRAKARASPRRWDDVPALLAWPLPGHLRAFAVRGGLNPNHHHLEACNATPCT